MKKTNLLLAFALSLTCLGGYALVNGADAVQSDEVATAEGAEAAEEAAAVELEPGDYYIYNVGKGLYLNGANSWGTKASVVKAGQLMTVAKLNSGLYTIDTHISNGGNSHYLGAGDAWTDNYGEHAIVANEDGTFAIINDGKYLTADDADICYFNAPELTDNGKWAFVTRDDILADMAKLSAGASLDVTSLIYDSNFGRNNQYGDKWVGGAVKGGKVEDFCAEVYNRDFDVYQDIPDMPLGSYILRVKGFYRGGWPGDLSEENNKRNALLYANNSTATLLSILAEAGKVPEGPDYPAGKLPNSMSDASAAFMKDMYTQELKFEHLGGTLRIGVKKNGHIEGEWTIFDNFQLIYCGVGVETCKAIYKSSKKTVDLPMNAEVREALVNAIAEAAPVMDNPNSTDEEITAASFIVANALVVADESAANYRKFITDYNYYSAKASKLIWYGYGGWRYNEWEAITNEWKDMYDNHTLESHDLYPDYIEAVKRQGKGGNYTDLLLNANFDTKDYGWKYSKDKNVVYGGSSDNPNAEGYQSNFDINQTIEGIYNGLYTITFQASYRNGNAQEAYNSEEKYLSSQLPYVEANGVKAFFPSIFSDAAQVEEVEGGSYVDVNTADGTIRIPNNMTAFSGAFSQGLYTTTMRVRVTDGTLKIGAYKTNGSAPAGNWAILDNFTITYEGNPYTEVWNEGVKSTYLLDLRDFDPYATDTEVDYTETDWNRYEMGYHPVANTPNGLISESAGWYQYFAADAFSAVPGEKYYLIVEMKAEQAVDPFNVDMRWNWGEDPVHVSLPVPTEWETVEIPFELPITEKKPIDVIFQHGAHPGKIFIKSIAVKHIAKTVAVLNTPIDNGDAEGEYGDQPCLWAKINYGDNAGRTLPALIETEKDADGNELDNKVFAVHAGAKVTDPWDNQVWIMAPESFKKGDVIKVSFRCKATKSAGAGSQEHGGTCNYINWQGLGTVNFSKKWKKFERIYTVQADNVQSIALNLNDFADANDYYFDNIEIGKFTEAPVSDDGPHFPINDGDEILASNKLLMSGLKIGHEGIYVERPWDSNYLADVEVTNVTTGYTYIFHSVGDVKQIDDYYSDNVITIGKGLFQPNCIYNIHIEPVNYVDFTRHLDEIDGNIDYEWWLYVYPVYANEIDYIKSQYWSWADQYGMLLYDEDGNVMFDAEGNKMYLFPEMEEEHVWHSWRDMFNYYYGDKPLPLTANTTGMDFTIITDKTVVFDDDSYKASLVKIYNQYGEEVADDGRDQKPQTPTAIANVNEGSKAPAAIYNAAGMKVNTMQRGLNIIKRQDGSTVKVMVK